LGRVAARLRHGLEIQTRRGHDHYAGITYLNLAQNAWQRGLAEEALAHCDASVSLLSSSSAGSELSTLAVTRAWAQLHLGDVDAGEQALVAAMKVAGPETNANLIECAEVCASYGDLPLAWSLISRRMTAQIRSTCLTGACLSLRIFYLEKPIEMERGKPSAALIRAALTRAQRSKAAGT
jgi:hypothetical protein